MKQFFRDYFTFNKRERNGVFVLIAIIILLIVYLNVSENFYKKEPVDFSKFEKEIAELENQSNKKSNYTENEEPVTPLIDTEINYFKFNPNNLSEENWMKLGVRQKQIKTIKNYEAKGGKFKKKEDFKKIYGISPELYSKLESYIVFSNEESAIDSRQNAVDKKLIDNETNKTINSKQQTQNILIELNSTDSAQLTSIKGIGSFYAKTIIKYRNSIGGFYKKEQLLEVWKFDKEKYNAIEKYITVDVTKITKININTCEAKKLKNPYINWNQANAIINYRSKHGMYKTIDEIKKTDLVDEETFRKIEPYLIIE